MADGSWHTITIEVHENVLQIFLDESKEGFDVEFSAVHNFMDSALDKVIIGGQGFRGCVTNFTLNNVIPQAPYYYYVGTAPWCSKSVSGKSSRM